MDDEWMCETCVYRGTLIAKEPCRTCADGSKYKPRESEDAE